MYPVFAKIIWNGIENKKETDDIWFFATDFTDAAHKIEEYFSNDLIGFSIYLFEENEFLFEDDRIDMEREAKTALGIW